MYQTVQQSPPEVAGVVRSTTGRARDGDGGAGDEAAVCACRRKTIEVGVRSRQLTRVLRYSWYGYSVLRTPLVGGPLSLACLKLACSTLSIKSLIGRMADPRAGALLSHLLSLVGRWGHGREAFFPLAQASPRQPQPTAHAQQGLSGISLSLSQAAGLTRAGAWSPTVWRASPTARFPSRKCPPAQASQHAD